MKDRVMGYQSFQGASTPADAVIKSVKGWKEKGKESTWWWTYFAVVLVACCPSREIVCKLQCKLCGTKFGPAHPSGTAKSHLSLGYARITVKRWLRKAKLQPFNKTLSDMAALIKENSRPTVQRINS